MTLSASKEIIKEFLFYFPYKLMHESGKRNPEVEHFFCIINRSHFKENATLIAYFNHYNKEFPLDDLSDQTNLFQKETLEDFIFVFIDTLEHKDSLFEKKRLVLEDNCNNILSLRLIGEVTDLPKHLNHSFDNYLTQAKDIGFGAGLLAKDALVDTVHKGKVKFQEHAPIVQKKAIALGNKLSDKIKSLKSKL